MIACVMCLGAVLGAVLGAFGVLFLELSLLAGIGIYFAVALSATFCGIAAMLLHDRDDAIERMDIDPDLAQ